MCDSEHQSDVMYSVSERAWEQGVGFNLLGASSIPRFVNLASMVEFSPGIHDGMGRIERVCWESLIWADEEGRWTATHSVEHCLHDLLSFYLHTLTPSHSSSHTNIFTYTPYHTTLIFTHPLTSLHSSHSSHPHYPCTHSSHPPLPSHTLTHLTPSLPSQFEHCCRSWSAQA